jgi:hypothetical protein
MAKRKSHSDWEASYQALMIITCHQLISMRDQLTDTIDMLIKQAPGFDFEIKKAGEDIKRIEEMLQQSRSKP